MGTKLGIRLLVLLLIAGGFIVLTWLWWIDAISARDPANNSTKIFVVNPGESVRYIATRLEKEKLIKNPIGFFIQVKLMQLENLLQAGDFRLSSSMDTTTIVRTLTHGTLDVWVTTLEGWRVEETAARLSQKMSIPEVEFIKYAQEGFMFPDTYLLPKEASAATIVETFRQNFDRKVTSDLKQAIENQELSFDEGVILASIVEREGRTDDDRPVIAGILLKRLNNGWALQADATLQYALGFQSENKTWWKKNLTDADKKIDSTYNTYINKGLPPAPISNPGLASIEAVAYSVTTDFWYYLHDQDGRIHYANTLEEHNANIAKYLQ